MPASSGGMSATPPWRLLSSASCRKVSAVSAALPPCCAWAASPAAASTAGTAGLGLPRMAGVVCRTWADVLRPAAASQSRQQVWSDTRKPFACLASYAVPMLYNGPRVQRYQASPARVPHQLSAAIMIVHAAARAHASESRCKPWLFNAQEHRARARPQYSQETVPTQSFQGGIPCESSAMSCARCWLSSPSRAEMSGGTAPNIGPAAAASNSAAGPADALTGTLGSPAPKVWIGRLPKPAE